MNQLDRTKSIETMLVGARRLTQIVEEMKARARVLFPKVYK